VPDRVDQTLSQGLVPLKKAVLSHMNEPHPTGVTLSSLKGEQLPNLIVLVVGFGLLAGALVLTPPHPGTPDVRLGGVYLPSVCTFYNLTGHSCPGCGLVRSVTAMAHGDLATSLAFHRLGWLVFAYIFVQMVYRGAVVFLPAWRTRIGRFGRHLYYGLIILASMLTFNWLVTLF
jgi:hypothetical protein